MRTQTFLLVAVLLCSFPNVSLSQNSDSGIQRYLSENKSSLGLTDADISDWIIYNEHTDKKLGITYKYLGQRYAGVQVYNALAVFAIMDDRIFLTGNDLQQSIAGRVNTVKPDLTPREAVERVARHLSLPDNTIEFIEKKDKLNFVYNAPGLSHEAIPVKLMLFPVDESEIRLVWDLNVYIPSKEHWWSIRVDALTGEILDQVDWVTTCSYESCELPNGTAHRHISSNEEEMTWESNADQSMLLLMPPPPPSTDQYRVYPIPTESPNHGGRALLVGPYNSVASPYGWHDDNGVAGNEYTTARGNNVYATEDANGNNGFGYTPSGGASLNFDFPLNLNQAPSGYQDPAITNLFYMNNVMHDIWYQYGFDEASGNFQENNYGNGGSASDVVYADAQDGSGTNNANFATPVDGQNPRMQMYLWSPATNYLLTVNSPAGVAGPYGAIQGSLGPPVSATPITADMAIFIDNAGGDNYDACETAVNGASLSGKIVVIRRGTCSFVSKIVAAESLGALAVIVVNNVPGTPIVMGGTDPGIGIPAVMISDIDGAVLIAAIEAGTVNGTLVDNGSYEIDGDLDNMIIAHEYGHGISKRLTGGAANSNCLTNSEQMGEGWSDWFGLMLTIEPGDLSTDNRGVGTYVTGESPNGVGIRPAPYNTNFAVNNYTYAATNNTANISQPHGIGFVWATMLWDLSWSFMDTYGFDPDLYNGTGGNNLVMQLVITALKLQPCSPGFVDGRDAILQADQMLYGGIHQCLIWNAFANRGLGYSANQGSASSRTDQVEAFDLPPGYVNSAGSENVTACSTYTWAANGQTYTSSGSYVAILTNAVGCDSTATLNLTIAPNPSGSETIVSCVNYTWPANGLTYSSSGVYTALLTNVNGCDSLATLNLTIGNQYSVTESVTACSAYTWSANGVTYSVTGMYPVLLTSVSGCDSLVTLDLVMSSSAATTQNVTACASYNWPADGNTYTSSGAYTVTLMAASGCDSIVTLNLVINNANSGTESVTSCDSYTWPGNGQTYTSSGTYSATLTNVSGCDSVASLNLTITNSDVNPTQYVSSCGSYTWSATGTTYASSGVYSANLSNVAGCDSNLVLDLSILSGSTGTESVTACTSYTWPANGTTYTSGGVYTATLSNAAGCDSLVTLVLTINTVTASINYLDAVTLTVGVSGANYQWLDCNANYSAIPGATGQTYAPTQNGVYACEVSLNGCIDTTDCKTISELGIFENDFGSALVVYPNPTFGQLTIDMGDSYELIHANVFDAQGRLLDALEFKNSQAFDLTLTGAPGFYLLELNTSDDRSARIRLMKE